MATLHLDDALYHRLKASADAHGCSPDVEAAVIIKADLATKDGLDSEHRRRATLDLVERLRARHAEAVARRGYLPDSTPLIREMRDEG